MTFTFMRKKIIKTAVPFTVLSNTVAAYFMYNVFFLLATERDLVLQVSSEKNTIDACILNSTCLKPST